MKYEITRIKGLKGIIDENNNIILSHKYKILNAYYFKENMMPYIRDINYLFKRKMKIHLESNINIYLNYSIFYNDSKIHPYILLELLESNRFFYILLNNNKFIYL